MDKIIVKIAISLLLVSLFLASLCTEKKETPSGAGIVTSTMEQVTATTGGPKGASTAETMPLSELQKAACDSADSGSTCKTKLADLGIVSLDDCCKYLSKCCPIN